MIKAVIFSVIFIIPANLVFGQWPLIDDGVIMNPSNQAHPYSKTGISGDYFDLVEGDIWSYKISGSAAFFRYRHQLEVEIPFVRSVYPGIENLTGLGDVKVGYLYVFYQRKSVIEALTHASASLKVSFPTGNPNEGHGVGKMVFNPSFFASFKPVEEISIHPSVKFFISEKNIDGDWAGGFPGAVPGSGLSEGERLKALQLDAAFNYEFNQAWIGVAPIYAYEFNQHDFTINLRPEAGVLLSEKFMIKINSTFYLAGERRLLSYTMFEASWYFY
jgi:hypothetical protein